MKFYFFILILASSKLLGQNLVFNGDFEELDPQYGLFPTQSGQIYYCDGWRSPNFSSPDYYHIYGLGDSQLPNCFWAYVTPFSGNAIAGIATNGRVIGNNYREYLRCELTAPLIVGKQYTLSFALTNGFSNQIDGHASDHFGFLFSTVYTWTSTESVLDWTPQIEIPGVVWDTVWREYSFDFIPDSAYTFLTIGNFFLDYETTIVFVQPSANPSSFFQNGKEVYYFIDDIELIRTVFSVACEIPNVFTPNGDGKNDYFKPIIIENINTMNTLVFNRWGNVVFESETVNFEWDGKNNSGKSVDEGVYFWKVEYEDVNEEKGNLQGTVTISR